MGRTSRSRLSTIADFARVANGKLDVIGGGWSMMNAQGPFGFFVAALFQTDLPHHPMTRHGLIHNLDALANFLCGLVGALFLAASFGDDPRWRPFRGAALILAVFSVVALVNQFLTDALRLPWSGVSNRVFAGSLVTWLLLTALHLRRVAAATTSAVST